MGDRGGCPEPQSGSCQAWRNRSLAIPYSVRLRIQAKSGRMLLRLTRSIRIKLGWLVALTYLLCVLAPGAALAFGIVPAPCFGDELPVVLASSTQAHMARTDDHGGMHVHHQADASDAPHKHGHDGKASPGPCCAMLCVTALPADPPTIVKPSQPVSLCASEVYAGLPGRTPPLLYRPPIA